MGRRITIPFIGQQSVARSVAVDNQETLNFITAIKGQGAKAPRILESAPGLVDVGTGGDGRCRTPHMVNFQGSLYGVLGRKLVEITDSMVNTTRGTLDDLQSTCQIARGRTHVMVVDGTKGYTWDGTTFGEITDLDFPANFVPPGKVTHCAYLDGFFICNNALTNNWFISALEDPDVWNALDFEAAAVSPDAALAVAANNAILWIIGDQTAQPYYNSGNIIFPYSLILSAVQEVGIAAPHSIAESDDGVFFMGTTPEGGLFVYRIQGQGGKIISGEEQDTMLSKITDPSASTGFIYKQAGKSFYVMNLEASMPSLVYNIGANAWETRAVLDGTQYRVSGHGVVGQQRNICGSRFSARLYEMDLDVYSDAGGTFLRRRRTHIYHKSNTNLDWWEVVVDVAPGVGLVGEGQGSDPTISLRMSKDNGQSWGPRLIEPIGKVGETEFRAVFRNLGQARNTVFELEASDPVEITLIGAYAVVEELDD